MSQWVLGPLTSILHIPPAVTGQNHPPRCHRAESPKIGASVEGECCPFLSFWFFGVCSASFCLFFWNPFFLKVVFGGHFWERTFVFAVLCWFVVFSRVSPMFLFHVTVFRSWKCISKIFWCQVFCFGAHFLFLRVLLRRRLFLFGFFLSQERKLRLTGHTPHRTRWSCLFSFCVPATLVYSPVLAVRPFFLAVCRGAILGPGCFVDSLGTS